MLRAERFEQLLLWAKEELDKRNVTFWLHAGTLLGAVKCGDFMENDSDVDVGFYEKDIPKVLEIIDSPKWNKAMKKESNGVLRIITVFKYYSLDMAIFRKRKGKYYIIGKSNKYGLKSVDFEAKTLNKLRNIRLRGVDYKAPDYTESYLDRMYGDWRINKEGGCNYDLVVPNNFYKEKK